MNLEDYKDITSVLEKEDKSLLVVAYTAAPRSWVATLSHPTKEKVWSGKGATPDAALRMCNARVRSAQP